MLRPLRLQSEFEESGLRKTKPNRDDLQKLDFLFVFLTKRMVCIFKKLREGLKNISSASTQTTPSEVSLEVGI